MRTSPSTSPPNTTAVAQIELSRTDEAGAIKRRHADTDLAIAVTGGTGTAPTALAAFDAALRACGVANFNLVRLSSVIPPGSLVYKATGPVAPPGGWGDRLYAVYAHESAVVPGDEAWAGIGWIQSPETGAGLFVEHEDKTEERVRSLILSSLQSIGAARHMAFGPPQMVLAGCHCEDEPVAAMVMAAYRSEGWETNRAAER
jgi:arginine decarboxylase